MNFKKLSIAFAFTFIQIATITNAMEKKIDLYSRIDYDKVFDQNGILQSPEFHNVLHAEGLTQNNANQSLLASFHQTQKTSNDLDEALVADFVAKKNAAMRQSFKKPLASAGANGTVSVAATLVGLAIHPMAGGLGAIGAAHNIGESIKDVVEATYDYNCPENDPLHKHELRYATIKRFYSPSLQTKIQDRFAAARKSPHSVDSVTTFLQTALSIPVQPKIPTAFPSSTWSTLDGLMDATLKDCDPNAKAVLKEAMSHHLMRQTSCPGTLNGPKIIPYLLGAAGTGKTFHAKRIAEFFKMPLLEVKITSNDASALLGDEQNPGAFLRAITKENPYNDAVVLIDDIDRILNANEDSSLNSAFLTFSEPSTQFFSSPYLGGSKIDTSRYFFILCGNNELKGDALKSRLRIIPFVLDAERKKAIVESKLPDLCSNTVPALHLNVKELSPEQRNQINQLIEKDTSSGFRDLERNLTVLLNSFRIEQAKKQAMVYPAADVQPSPSSAVNVITRTAEAPRLRDLTYSETLMIGAMLFAKTLTFKSFEQAEKEIGEWEIRRRTITPSTKSDCTYWDENDGVCEYVQYISEQGGRTDYDY